MQGDEPETGSWWRHQRKKVVAREVPRAEAHGSNRAAASEVEREMRAAATLSTPAPEDGPYTPSPVQVVVVPIGTLSAKVTRPPESILDPTLMGVRHRKHNHTFAYRLTQLTTLVAFLAATSSIVCQLLDEPLSARLYAIAAVLLALGSLRLVRLTHLSSRLRGYAVGATVLAGIALTLTLAAVIWHDDPGRLNTHPANPAPSGASPAAPPAGPRQF